MKRVKKIISIVLAVLIVASVVPAMEFNGGSGVFATTSKEIVDDANSWVGYTPYVDGGNSLTTGCDCSGFVCQIFKRHGLDFSTLNIRSGFSMQDNISSYGVNVGATVAAMQDGYIIIFDGGKHVGICATASNGTKEVIHAANSSRGTRRDSINWLITGSNAMRITAVVRPNCFNDGKTYSNVTRTGGTPSSQTNDTTNTTSANNPGNPLAIPVATVTSSNRDGVKWVQTALNRINGAGLTVDGALGPLTETAIKNFQTKYGLSATGIADVTTINKMVEVYKLSASITSIAINQQGVTLEEGKTLQLTTTISPASAQSVKVSWSSSNGNNASVSSTGLVTAVEGCETDKVTITAKTPNGKTASTTVSIIGKPRKNEWFKGKWYSADGKQTYKPTGSWKLGSGGWWYGDTSGWWAYSQWQKIDDKWYYFNANGYIYTGWHQINGVWYYFKSSGEMAENEWCNGYWLSKGGAWSYQSTGKWKHNSTGWWYEDTNGWYAKNETIKINGVKYTFNKDGYWDGKY